VAQVPPPPVGQMAPPQAVPPAQRPVRVQSVLRGPDQASCLQQALVDGERATAHGYRPVWQAWGQENGQVTLTILYDLVQAQAPVPTWTAGPAPMPQAPLPQAPMPTMAPTPQAPLPPAPMPPAPMPPATPGAPATPGGGWLAPGTLPQQAPQVSQPQQGWTAPAPAQQAPQVPPAQQGWTVAAPPVMQAPQVPPAQQGWTVAAPPVMQAPQMPPTVSAQRSISNRVIGAILSIIVFVAVYLLYGLITRNF